ncbi:hypothetical protein Tco_0412037 [Tanacetum coccineum]
MEYRLNKRIWIEVKLHGDQGNRIAEVFQDSNNAAAVAQKKLKDKKLEEKKKQTEGALGAEKKKVKEPMEANLEKLLKCNAWSTSRSPV